MKNTITISEITKEQLKLMHFASQHTKMPVTSEEVLEISVQSYYTNFKKEFPELFPKYHDPIHPSYWV
jgi:hypothetical protein